MSFTKKIFYFSLSLWMFSIFLFFITWLNKFQYSYVFLIISIIFILIALLVTYLKIFYIIIFWKKYERDKLLRYLMVSSEERTAEDIEIIKEKILKR